MHEGSKITAILSLSYSLRFSRNFMSPSSLFEGPQKSSIFLPEPEGSLTLSGLMSLMTHTADMTSFIPEGGFFIVLTIVMSAGFNVLRAANADSSAGMASARSLSHYTHAHTSKSIIIFRLMESLFSYISIQSYVGICTHCLY